MKSHTSPPGSLVRNFFIVLPNGSNDLEGTNAFRTENILDALRAALGATPPTEVQPTAGRATFEAVGREWYQNRVAAWAPSYAGRLRTRLESGLLSHLGGRLIADISPQDILEVIRTAEARDVRETARRILQIASAIFRYGIATGRCASDPTIALKGALKSPRAVKHRATLLARDLPKFLRDLEGYQSDLTRNAMKLMLLTFVRTAELRFAKWSELECLEGSDPLWRVPAERMKMRRAHLVPLSKQALNVLRSIRGLGLGSDYLFPANTKRGVISENTLLFALYRMGYRKRATVHGFRSLASTVLNEAQFNRDWIEMQLAHADNSVRGIYNSAEWLSGRRNMLQWWADYVDVQQAGRDRRNVGCPAVL